MASNDAKGKTTEKEKVATESIEVPHRIVELKQENLGNLKERVLNVEAASVPVAAAAAAAVVDGKKKEEPVKTVKKDKSKKEEMKAAAEEAAAAVKKRESVMFWISCACE